MQWDLFKFLYFRKLYIYFAQFNEDKRLKSSSVWKNMFRKMITKVSIWNFFTVYFEMYLFMHKRKEKLRSYNVSSKIDHKVKIEAKEFTICSFQRKRICGSILWGFIRGFVDELRRWVVRWWVRLSGGFLRLVAIVGIEDVLSVGFDHVEGSVQPGVVAQPLGTLLKHEPSNDELRQLLSLQVQERSERVDRDAGIDVVENSRCDDVRHRHQEVIADGWLVPFRIWKVGGQLEVEVKRPQLGVLRIF